MAIIGPRLLIVGFISIISVYALFALLKEDRDVDVDVAEPVRNSREPKVHPKDIVKKEDEEAGGEAKSESDGGKEANDKPADTQMENEQEKKPEAAEDSDKDEENDASTDDEEENQSDDDPAALEAAAALDSEGQTGVDTHKGADNFEKTMKEEKEKAELSKGKEGEGEDDEEEDEDAEKEQGKMSSKEAVGAAEGQQSPKMAENNEAALPNAAEQDPRINKEKENVEMPIEEDDEDSEVPSQANQSEPMPSDQQKTEVISKIGDETENGTEIGKEKKKAEESTTEALIAELGQEEKKKAETQGSEKNLEETKENVNPKELPSKESIVKKPTAEGIAGTKEESAKEMDKKPVEEAKAEKEDTGIATEWSKENGTEKKDEKIAEGEGAKKAKEGNGKETDGGKDAIGAANESSTEKQL